MLLEGSLVANLSRLARKCPLVAILCIIVRGHSQVLDLGARVCASPVGQFWQISLGVPPGLRVAPDGQFWVYLPESAPFWLL